MVYIFKIIYWLAVSEAVLRDLYFWQLKEYRWDRFREFIKTGEAVRYFFPGRHWLRPKFTVKAGLIFLISLVLILQLDWWLGYLLTWFIVALSVGAVNPWSGLIKSLIVFIAKIKLSFFRRRLVVIGITGSFGKSSTKEILAHVLTAKFRVLKTAANNNTLIGVAKTILFKLNRTHEVFVVEMGAYKRGEIKEICNLVKPKIGILTGINEQHAGLFGGIENTIKAKSELIEALPKNGLALINGDNANSNQVAKKNWPAKIRIYRQPQKKYLTNLPGSHQQLNIAAAIAAAIHLGISKKDIEEKLKIVPAIKTALTQTRGLKGAKIILDNYSSNRDGFLAAIAYCRELTARRKILVTPGISELGKSSDAVHADIAKNSVAVFDKIFVTKADAKRWFKGADLVTETELKKKLATGISKLDLILLEGRLSAKLVEWLCRR